MSRRFHLEQRSVIPACRMLLAAALLLMLPTRIAWGCLAECPNDMTINLSSPDEKLLLAPTADFVHEMELLKPAAPPFRAVFPKEGQDDAAQTIAADIAELRQAMESRGIAPQRVARIVQQYKTVRTAIKPTDDDDDPSPRAVLSKRKKTPKTKTEIKPPDLIPEEFALYLQGAIAYRQKDHASARAAWQKLLALDPKERHYRSTWAAYMLGRCPRPPRQHEDASVTLNESIASLRLVRELAAQGFADSLGLAAASLGWEGRAQLDLNHVEQAVDLYLLQFSAGDARAAWSLRDVAASVMAHVDVADFPKHAVNPTIRQLLTAYLVSHGGPFHSGPKDDRALAWLNAIEQANVRDMSGADRIAWAAYDIGKYDLAQRWVDRAQDRSPVALWIRSKLLLQKGQIPEAMEALAKAVRAFPANEEWAAVAPSDGGYPPRHQVMGELGVLQMSRGKYVEALDLLARSGHWCDAAFIAERVLTVKELAQYVDQSWPAPAPAAVPAKAVVPPAAGADDKDKDASPDAEDNKPVWTSASATARDVRYVLARRLARLGQWAQARAYYPAERLPDFDHYVQAVQTGRDKTLSNDDRAAALMRAARILMGHGMELLGTEAEPDFSDIYGAFEGWGTMCSQRLSAIGMIIAAPSADEQRRITANNEIRPNVRFHYRYIAAEYAWTASLLLPDDAEATARVLYEAGCWLKARDHEAANRFYRALVLRCGKTALGRAAAARHWFPPPAKS